VQWRREWHDFVQKLADPVALPARGGAWAAVTKTSPLPREDWRRPRPPGEIVGLPHGGMAPKQRAKAGALVAVAIGGASQPVAHHYENAPDGPHAAVKFAAAAAAGGELVLPQCNSCPASKILKIK